MKKIVMIVMMVMLFAKVAIAANTNSIDLESSSSQYLSAPDSPSLSVTGNITLEGWIKFESLGTIQVIASKFENATNNRSYSFYRDTDGRLYFVYSPDGAGASLVTHASNVIYASTGVWYHFAVVFTAASHSSTFYQSGAVIGTANSGSATSIYNGAAAFMIGAEVPSIPRNYLDGLIDDVRVWNVARTQQQILDNYQTELVGNEPGLAGYWKLGSTTDSTANGNILSNYSGAAYSADVPFLGGSTPPPPPPPPAATCSIVGNIERFTSIIDINASTYPENVFQGIDATGIPTVCIVDVVTEDFIKEIKFFSAGWTVKSISLVPDMSNPKDGIPEISIMANSGTQNKIQIKDTVSEVLTEIPLPQW